MMNEEMNEEEMKNVMVPIMKAHEKHIYICKRCGKEIEWRDISGHAKETKHHEYKSKTNGANLGLLVG